MTYDVFSDARPRGGTRPPGAPPDGPGGREAPHGTPRTGSRWHRVTALLLVASVTAVGPAASRYGWAVTEHRRHAGAPGGMGRRAHAAAGAARAERRGGHRLCVPAGGGGHRVGLVTPGIIPYRRQGEAGVLRYLERACPDYLIIFPVWFPQLAAMSDRFTPIYRIRLDHNKVAGADEMVVYETPWTGARGTRASCDARNDRPVPSTGKP